jgi:hypothetical protein
VLPAISAAGRDAADTGLAGGSAAASSPDAAGAGGNLQRAFSRQVLSAAFTDETCAWRSGARNGPDTQPLAAEVALPFGRSETFMALSAGIHQYRRGGQSAAGRQPGFSGACSLGARRAGPSGEGAEVFPLTTPNRLDDQGAPCTRHSFIATMMAQAVAFHC